MGWENNGIANILLLVLWMDVDVDVDVDMGWDGWWGVDINIGVGRSLYDSGSAFANPLYDVPLSSLWYPPSDINLLMGLE